MIYIVSGSSGKYDDYTEWNIKAFVTKKKATAFKNKCQRCANSIIKKAKKEGTYYFNIVLDNKYDPDMKIYDADGPKYSIWTIELES